MITMTIGEATAVVSMILTMEGQDIITAEEAFAAIKKVPYYEEIFAKTK